MALDVAHDAPYHDAMADFHEASKLTPARLGPATPLGFFRSLDTHSNATAFWIVELDGVKSAIILEAVDPKWVFDTVSLAHADDTAWSGVSLGPVEVLVDLTSGQFVDEPRLGRGAITITGGKIIISAVPSGRLGSRVSFEVGDAGTPAGQVAGIFGRWQLVQRDHAGRPVVLFELD